jgi:hypothetical protein
MRITLMYWAECGSHREAIARIKEVLAEENLEADIEEIEVSSEDLARRPEFAGSPTILVDGEDIDPETRDSKGRLTCRAYRKPDGSISPIPDKEMIRGALLGLAKEGRVGESGHR